ncbi:MAG: DUF2147 domain-containing protein [Alphaproteobacteria bacterium]|nr:DUF2147 domain-containing protein [Alphaproteobacteria bacterium]
MIRKISFMFTALFLSQSLHASPILGVWETERQEDESRVAHVKIETCADNAAKLCGKIVWLEEPNDPETGKPKLDKNNPNESLRNLPVLNSKMLWGFTATDTTLTKYEGGEIYSAGTGKTYSGSMELKDPDTLHLTGHVFIFSKTQTWKRVKNKK